MDKKRLGIAVVAVVMLAVVAVIVFGNIPADDAQGRVSKVLKGNASKVVKVKSSNYGMMNTKGKARFTNLIPMIEAIPERNDFGQYRTNWIQDCTSSQELADAFNNGVLYTYDECSDLFDQMSTPTDGMIPSTQGSLCDPPGSTKTITHIMVIDGESIEAEMTCTCSGGSGTSTWDCV